MQYTLNIKGRLMELTEPQVMGILNVTPDSFYAASRAETKEAIAERARQIAGEGGTIIDIGACSTRPVRSLPRSRRRPNGYGWHCAWSG